MCILNNGLIESTDLVGFSGFTELCNLCHTFGTLPNLGNKMAYWMPCVISGSSDPLTPALGRNQSAF